MSSHVHVCRTTDDVSECARILRAHDIGFLPVLDPEGALRGVVTDRDLAMRVLANSDGPKLRVEEIMSRWVVSCGPDDDLRVAEERMGTASVSRIVVISQRECVGVISLSDILRVEEPTRSAKLARTVASREWRAPPSLR